MKILKNKTTRLLLKQILVLGRLKNLDLKIQDFHCYENFDFEETALKLENIKHQLTNLI